MTDPGYGTIWGPESDPAFITDEGEAVWMWRKGQRVRFYTADGVQVGPEQKNVGPAMMFARFNGWTDPSASEMWNWMSNAEVRRKTSF